LHRLEGVEFVAYPPEHEVRVASQAREREGAQEHGPLVFLDGSQELPLPLPTLLARRPTPLGVELEERVIYVLGRELLPGGGPKLRLRLCYACISSTLEKSNPERLSSRRVRAPGSQP
jgi:hypothetical protein